jgi:hypothetical protein
MTRTVSPSRLREAAEVAVAAGVTITIEAPNGTLYRITPAAAPLPLGATEREQAACDQAFGVGTR